MSRLASPMAELLLPQIRTEATSVSSPVMKMLSLTFQAEESRLPTDAVCLRPDGHINWELLTMHQMIGDGYEAMTAGEQYKKAAPYIKEVAMRVHGEVMSWTRQDFKDRFQDNFVLFLKEETPMQVWEAHRYRGESHLALLITIAQFDRAIGDVLHILAHGKITIPKKMRLILGHPHLQKIVGPDKTFLLKLMMGSLESLNLRNLLWHGFLLPEECPPEYASLLIVVLLSLSSVTSILRDHPRRASVDITQYTPLLLFGGVPPLLFDSDLSASHILELEALFHTTAFILPGHVPFWKQALYYYCRGQYTFALSLLFPELEHSIRRMFVCLNHCSDRLWTAEQNVLYSTLDILLAHTTVEEGHPYDALRDETVPTLPNYLFAEVPEGIITALEDLFVWFEGPRMRDRVAHASIDEDSLTLLFVQRILGLCIALCRRYDCGEEAPPLSIASRCSQFFENYRSCFHPKIFIQRQILDMHRDYAACYQLLHQVQGPAPNQLFDLDLARRFVEVQSQRVLQQQEREGLPFFHRDTPWLNAHLLLQEHHSWEHHRLPCLKCSSSEMSKMGYLGVTLTNVSLFLKKVSEAYQDIQANIATRKASTAHKKNFAQLCHLMPYFLDCAALVMQRVALSLLQPHEPDIEQYQKAFEIVAHATAIVEGHVWRKVALYFCCALGDTGQDLSQLSHREKSRFAEFSFK
eukprot:TRINITY_DN5786_c0_g1_i3.p1 TRINITY_DN5786_c0_g1~~TRINITY_DN5786_c0_g1_i3.p1  ORF type:complete len:694 (-),score=103.24 TRINITY_DN5786_c0_g1_i3:41-2122(-)